MPKRQIPLIINDFLLLKFICLYETAIIEFKFLYRAITHNVRIIDL